MALSPEQFFKEVGKGPDYLDQWGVFKDIPIYNPDELIGKKGIKVYDEMVDRDGQVKSSLFLKKYGRLSTGWHIQPASDDNIDREAAAFVDFCITEYMEGTMSRVLLAMMKAFERGYSTQEIVFEMIDEGEFKGKAGLKRVHARRQKDMYFQTDENGNLDKQIGLQQMIHTTLVPMPLEKFIIYTYQFEDDNYYGKSDCRAAYKYSFLKDIIERYLAVFLEQFGSPAMGAKYKPGTPRPKVEKILETMRTMMTGKRFAYPSDWEVTLLEASHQSGGTFENALNYFNKMIARAILVPSLIQDEGAAHGSYSLGRSHVAAFIWVLQQLGEEIEDIISEQLIRKLVRPNYAVTRFPKFKFKKFREEKLQEIAQMFVTMANAGVKIPISHIREALGIREPEEDEDTIGSEKAGGSGIEVEPEEPEEPVPPEVETPGPEALEGTQKFVEMARAGLWRPPTELEEKVNWERVSAQEKREMESSAARMGLTIEAMRDAVIDEVRKKKQ